MVVLLRFASFRRDSFRLWSMRIEKGFFSMANSISKKSNTFCVSCKYRKPKICGFWPDFYEKSGSEAVGEGILAVGRRFRAVGARKQAVGEAGRPVGGWKTKQNPQIFGFRPPSRLNREGAPVAGGHRRISHADRQDGRRAGGGSCFRKVGGRD
jgi:hypothetical protein